MTRSGTLLFLLILLLIPAFYFFSPSVTPLRFQIAKSQMFVVEFKGKGYVHESQMGVENLLDEFTFEGKFIGKPDPHPSGALIRGLFHKFSASNSLGQVLIAFEKKEDGTHTYHIDPALSSEERARIFDFLRIDLTSKLATDDYSLFQEPLTFFIRENLTLEEVSLPPLLRENMHKGLGSYFILYLIKEFLASSQRLPPLLPKEGSPKQWIREGNFLTPLAFTSRANSPLRDNIEYTTKSSLPSGEETNFPPWKARRNEWNLTWVFEKEAGKLHVLNGEVIIELVKNLLGNQDYLAYRFQFASVFDYPPRTPEIQELHE